MDYIRLIHEFPAITPQEISDKRLLLKYINEFPHTILTRENEYAHITSSSMIFNENRDKVLMVYHNIYQSWSWTGGHADGDGDLFSVALREAEEETGASGLNPLSEDMISIDILPVWGHMKHGKYISTHEHLNVTYALTAAENQPLCIKSDENSAVQWILIDKLTKMVSEPDMIPVYEKIINRVLNTL